MLEETGFSECTVKMVRNIWKSFLYSSQNQHWTCPRGHKEPSPLGFHLPNIHTSLAEVKRRKLMDSGAIHLMGNFPLEATGKAGGGRLLSPLQSSKIDSVPRNNS